MFVTFRKSMDRGTDRQAIRRGTLANLTGRGRGQLHFLLGSGNALVACLAKPRNEFDFAGGLRGIQIMDRPLAEEEANFQT